MSVVEMAMALESNFVYARIPQQAPECRSTANWGSESGWEDPAQRSEWASVSSTSISVASTLVKDEPDENGRAAAGGLSDGSSSVMTLKLGRRTYFEDPAAKPPGKKPRHPSPPSAAQIPRCQVEGCKADLSGCKDYYKRHKVCEMHSKAPRAVAGGIEQRFCQQCSRFHVLQEFDEGKRSCRRRLAGHNERRRKPHPETHSLFGLGNSFLHTNFSTPSLNFSEDSKPLNLLNPQSSSSLDYRLDGYGSSPWSVKGRNDNIPTFQLENLEAPSTPSKPSSLSSLHLGGHHFVEGPLGPLGQGLSLGNLEQSISCSQDLMMNSGRALSLLSSQSSWASRPYLGASSTPVDSTLEQLVASSCISDSSSRESRFAHHLRFPAQQESFSLQSGARQLDSVTTHQHQSCSNVGNMLGAWYQEWNPMSLEAASYEADRPTVDLMQQHSVGAPHSSFQTLAVSGGQYSGFSSLRQSLESSVFTSQQFL